MLVWAPLPWMTEGISKSTMQGRTLSTVKAALCASTPPALLFTVIVQSVRSVAAVAGGDVGLPTAGCPAGGGGGGCECGLPSGGLSGGEGDGGGQRAASDGDLLWQKGIVGIEGEGDGGRLCGV